MKRIGRLGMPGGPGQLDKVLLVVLGLLAVVLVRWLGPDVAPRSMGTSAQAVATPLASGPTGPTGGAIPPPPEREPTATPEPAAANTPDPPYWRVSTDGGVNMRANPSQSAPVLLRLADNEVITNLDKQQVADGIGWRNVALGDIAGWVAGEFLVPQYE